MANSFIRIDLEGDREVGLRFEQFPDTLHEELQAEITSLSTELLARVQAATPVRTGLLLSEERVRVFSNPDGVRGEVDIDAGKVSGGEYAKAGALEYGAHRTFKEVAHPMRLDHLWAEKLAAPMTVMTKAFDRTPNIAEVAFERGPLAQMQPEVSARLNAAVERAVAASNE